MNGSTKILTVSYGTFSCTLEGFDDPISRMRDIAEYFRDLAAEDRYFGAEPPTPDVEMLQQIAQKEVQRRVEARVSETGVALRQVPDEAEVVTEEPVRRPKSDPVRVAEAKAEEDAEDHGALTFDDEFLMSDEPEDVLAVDPGARPPADGPAESVAEKLRRIRAVVSRSIEQKDADPSFSAPQAPTADQDTSGGGDRALSETIRQIQAGLLDDEDATGQEAHATSDISEVSEPQAKDEREAVPEGIIVADLKIEVAQPAAEAPEEKEVDLSDVPEPAETVAAIETAEPEAEDLPDLETEPVAEVEPEFEEPAVVEPVQVEIAVDEPEDDIVAALADEVGGAVDISAQAPADDGDGWEFDEDRQEAPASVDETEETDESAARRRVTELLGSQELAAEEDENEVLELDQSMAVPVSRPATRQLEPEPESDVGRLLAETDTKLNDDEFVRRRRVISQMRAAVAATKADRLVSRQVSKETEEEVVKSRYRDDLSQAVRSRAPLPGETQRRPSDVPPLVLVSSQRVDIATPAHPKKDDRPRPMPVEAEGFAQFAQSVGAYALPDLLEAAAAYTVFNEGQSSFTRPEIMKRVARVDPSIRLSREESLRTFGQLLRQGKFHKLERGQFTIAEDTRFHPEQRFAGE